MLTVDTELVLLCTGGSDDVCTWGPYCFGTPFLKYSTFCSKQPPHKHLHTCPTTLPCPALSAAWLQTFAFLTAEPGGPCR